MSALFDLSYDEVVEIGSKLSKKRNIIVPGQVVDFSNEMVAGQCADLYDNEMHFMISLVHLDNGKLISLTGVDEEAIFTELGISPSN